MISRTLGHNGFAERRPAPLGLDDRFLRRELLSGYFARKPTCPTERQLYDFGAKFLFRGSQSYLTVPIAPLFFKG